MKVLCPHPINACLLLHKQTRQLLLVARAQGTFRTEGYEIQITADFSNETNDRRKAFLALRPQLCQLEVKYGLFEPEGMWVAKNSVSKDFYDPEDLCLFLEGLQTQSMDTTTPARAQELSADIQ
ncbi:hypothetical protein NDU88_003225 [Pleurodeles waltl]|uniref:Uncharacterized protein n=1 Tax=Pleurodeles waltl TaxID=8319 RepID=A0AAV7WNH5_PLEWA|nr:hypothetical protein NDU88_003225 [Pleurodeles waltl]